MTTPILPDHAARDAVRQDVDHHLIVAANPGSGKTQLLTDKLLVELGPDRHLTPEHLVAITFTRAAAAELRSRLTEGCLRRLRDEPAHRTHWTAQLQRLDQAMIGTIDRFVGRFLHQYGALGGLPEAPTLLEPASARELAAAVSLDLLQNDTTHPGARLLLRQYDLLPARDILTNALLGVDALPAIMRQAADQAELAPSLDPMEEAAHVAALAERDLAGLLVRAHERFQAALQERGAADYGRLLIAALELARQPAVVAAFRRDVALLCVDEHQDTSELQVRFFQRLLGLPAPRAAGATRGLFLGDPQQSIYQFRGADITMWRQTERLVLKAGGQRFALETTFRTRPALVQALNDTVGTILRTADESTNGAYDYAAEPMIAVRQELEQAPAPLTFLRTPGKSPREIAEALAAQIAAWLADPTAHPVSDPDGTIRPLAPRDIAVLAPVLRGVAPAYVEAFSAAGIPVRVQGGAGLFARPEVEDLTQALRALVNDDPQEMLAWLQGPFGGVPFPVLMAATQGVPLATVLSEAAAGRGHVTLQQAMARRAAWRALVDQIPHAAIASRMLEESGARARYTARPDGLLALRNFARLLDLLSAPPLVHQPLWTVALHLKAVIAQRDFEEEAACFAEGDDVVTVATIHQAKGLEWPMVILVGQESTIARRNDGDAPAVQSGWGVVLPLPVAMEGPEGDLTTTPRWQEYVRDQEAREVAEAKRKLFVAATRARDYLVVAAAFTVARYPRELTPTELLGAPGKRVYDSMLRWWRFLGRPGLGNNPTAQTVTMGATICPILEPIALVPLVGPQVDRESGAVRPHQMGPVAPDMPLRAEVTASELLMHDQCPFRHARMFRDGVNLPELDVAGADAAVNRLAPADRGTILHRYLFHTAGRDDQATRLRRMESAIRLTVAMPDEALAPSVEAMMLHADAVENSEWWTRVLAAPRVYREVTMTIQTAEHTLLTVTLDLVWQDPDGIWNIMDFKSLLLRGITGDALVAEIAERARGYRMQAAAYVTALQQVLGADAQLGHFVFLFSGVGQAVAVPLDEARQRVSNDLLVAGLRGIQGPRPTGVPTWRPTQCPACPVRATCAVRIPETEAA